MRYPQFAVLIAGCVIHEGWRWGLGAVAALFALEFAFAALYKAAWIARELSTAWRRLRWRSLGQAGESPSPSSSRPVYTTPRSRAIRPVDRRTPMHPHDAPPASTAADALDALAGLLVIGALFLALAALSWCFSAPPGDYSPIPSSNAEP